MIHLLDRVRRMIEEEVKTTLTSNEVKKKLETNE